MACDYKCPYCGSEIFDQDYWDSQPEEEYEVECGDCEHTFNVSYSLDPVFRVELPSELEPCWDCDCWNGIDECCLFGTQEQIRINQRCIRCGLEPSKPLDNCPLGHVMERDA